MINSKHEVVERNSVKCLLCNDEIVSTHRHDMRWCKCGNVAVDGGNEYRRRVFTTNDWVDTSDYREADVIWNDDGSPHSFDGKPWT